MCVLFIGLAIAWFGCGFGFKLVLHSHVYFHCIPFHLCNLFLHLSCVAIALLKSVKSNKTSQNNKFLIDTQNMARNTYLIQDHNNLKRKNKSEQKAKVKQNHIQTAKHICDVTYQYPKRHALRVITYNDNPI